MTEILTDLLRMLHVHLHLHVGRTGQTFSGRHTKYKFNLLSLTREILAELVVVVVVVTVEEVLPGIEDPTTDPSRRFYSNTMSP